MPEQRTAFHAPVPRAAPEIVVTSSSGKRLMRAGAGNSSGGGTPAVGPQLVLHALRRWWKIALPAGVLLAAAAVGYVYYQFEPQYEAAALLEISERDPYVAYKPDDGGVSKGYFRTQMDLIRSRWIIGRAVASQNVKELPEVRKQADPIEWLRKKIKVVFNDSDLFEIRYTSLDPESAALVVNEVTRQYLTAMDEEESSRFRRILDALNAQQETREEKVRTLRKQVEMTTEKLPLEEPEKGQEDTRAMVRNPVADLKTQLVTIQVQRAMLAARIRATEDEILKAEGDSSARGSASKPTATPAGSAVAKTSSAATNGDLAKSNAAPANSDVAMSTAVAARKPVRPLTEEEETLRDQLVEQTLETAPEIRQMYSVLLSQQLALDQLKKIYKDGEKDPSYIRKKNEVADYEKTIDVVKEKLRPRAIKEVEFAMRTRLSGGASGVDAAIALAARRREELAGMKLDLHSLEIAEDNLRNDYKIELKKVLTEREQLSGESLNLKFMKDELSEAQSVLSKINDRLVMMQTERNAPPRVAWHEPAKAPHVPVEVLPYQNMSLTGLVAFCLPFALAVAWEIRARRIGSPEDLEQQVHMTVLGEIARLPTRNRAASKLADGRVGAELRIFEESIDSLRTALTLSDDLRDMRFLAITSAANSEGKTSVASQLALSLARATGKATLLIDGDMRSPDVHQVFGVAREPGLAEVLSKECSLGDAIVPTHNPNVQLLPAGRLKVSPHRLLGNGAWKSLLSQIPDSYGYIIIDTPPVLAASEALVLSKYADAILICVMRDVSRADQVRKASNLLTAAGGCPVGTVLNGVPLRSYKYYYGSYPSHATQSQS